MEVCKVMFVIVTCLFLSTSFAKTASAEESSILFQDDFENAVINGSPNPVWSWQTPFSKDNPYGMMYGEGDIYSNKEVSLGGRLSRVLSLNFNGRNGFCNICGSATEVVTASELQEQCLSTSGGPFSSKIFNKDGGFSIWATTGVDVNNVCFDGTKPVGSSLFGDNAIEAGDELKLPYQCGINGTIGNDVDRRSDCNLAINYLNDIKHEHFQPGMVLSRRMYLYIPQSTILPDNGVKLGYTVFQRPNERAVGIIPVIRTSRKSRLEIEGGSYFDYQFANYHFARDVWHYIEEVWTRESATGKRDGSYRLYAGEVGSDTAVPLLSLTDIEYGDIKKLSIIGNWQHQNDAIGNVYIDNVMVANRFIGQGDNLEGLQGLVNPPTSPTLYVE